MFKEWISVELTAENRSMLYLPADCGHGYQTLVDDTEVFYLVSQVTFWKWARISLERSGFGMNG